MGHSIAAIIRCRLTRRFGDRFSIYSGPCSRSGALKGIEIRAALFALTLTALMFTSGSKMHCWARMLMDLCGKTGATELVKLLASNSARSLAKTDNVNAAMAAVFADCSIEEEGLYAQLQIDWHMTADTRT